MTRRVTIALVAAILAVFMMSATPSSAQKAASIDLRSYYPNPQLAFTGKYLDGYNYLPSGPARSVLWFQDMGSGKWRMYNSLPGERCHYDELRWSSSILTYAATQHRCEGDVNDTIYSPGITFLPRSWNGTYWTRTGSSKVTQKLNGVTVCTGTNTWKAEVLGWVNVAPNEPAIHWRTTQTTKWTTGSCAPWTTRWQEDYYLTNSLPNGGKGLKRSVGGNLDGGFNWDVWFDSWRTV